MRRLMFLLTLALLLTSCQTQLKVASHTTASTASTQKYDADDLSRAALSHIVSHVDYGVNTLEDLKRARVKLQCIRTWAEQVPDYQVSRAYLKWIDALDNGYNETERSLLHPESLKEGDWESQCRAEQARADALDIPVPPSRACQGAETEFKGTIGGARSK